MVELGSVRETFEFRIPADRAPLLFGEREGRLVGAEKVASIAADDPRFARVGELDADFRARGEEGFFSGFRVRRAFTDAEVRAAELFHVDVRRVLEPPGDACGTDYDAAAACSRCGLGRRRTSPLRLDCRRIAGAAIARTVGNEIVVSAAVGERLVAGGFTGFDLRPVEKPRAEWPGPFRLESVPSGRALVERARRNGVEPGAFEFSVFANEPEQRALLDAARREAAPPLPEPRVEARFLELAPTASAAEIAVPPTRFGRSPFDPDVAGRYRCDGHTLGLRLLSPVTIARDALDPEADLVATRQAVGWPTGLAAAAPLLLASPRLAAALRAMSGRDALCEPAALV